MFRPHPSVGASPSSDAAGNTYVWVGTTGSAWDAPADWNDTTTGTMGISAPGRGDVARITGAVGPGASPLLVVGGGEAAALTVVGPVSLEGNYQLGSLIVGGSLELGPPPQQTGTAAVSVERLQLRIGSILSLYQADLSVAGSSIVFGNIDLSTGSSLQAGNLKLVRSSPYNGGPGIEVDATSTVEIGHAGGAEAGSITIDKGFSLSAGFLEGTVVDNGSLVVNGRMGITSFFGSDTLTGSGVVQIGARSEFSASAVAAGLTIDFAGPGGLLALEDLYTTNPVAAGAPVVGFVAGDAISFTDDITAATTTPISGGERLVLTNAAGQVVDTLTLRGETEATTYLLVHALGGTLVVAAPAARSSKPPSAGTSGHDRYVWTGALGADWGSAGNWVDATTGGTATVAPGRHDEVSIKPGQNGVTMVTGVGQADTLTIIANGYPPQAVLIDGKFRFDAITGSGTLLEIGSDSVITTDHIGLPPHPLTDLFLTIEGATLRAGSDFGSSWSLLEGATVQIRAAESIYLRLDATSRFEVGNAGGAAAGVLTIDAGARMSGGNIIDGTVVDNGTLRVDGRDDVSGMVEGSGNVVITAGATLYTGYGLAGVAVDFVGSDAGLMLGLTGSGNAFSMTGFKPGDAMFLSSDDARSSYRSDGDGHGTLTLTDAYSGDTLAVIQMIGDYIGDQFLLTNDTDFREDIIVLPSAVSHANPSAGTASTEQYVWSAGLAQGAWGKAANWQNSTTGSAATVAPGRLDDVTITGGFPTSVNFSFIPSPPPLVIVGSGDAQTLTTNGQVVFDGIFNVAAFDGALRVAGQGSTLTAGTLTSFNGIDVDGGRVLAGSVTAGSVSVEDGGTVSLGSLSYSGPYYLDTISVDATASLVVGPASTVATPGTITVASGATISDFNGIRGPLHDDGVVQAQQMGMVGPVSGSGELVEQGDEGHISIGGSVVGTIGITVAGSGVELSFTDPVEMDATINGFADSDYMQLAGLLSATSLAYSFSGNDFGALTLSDSHQTKLASLDLAGDYRGATFMLTALAGYGQQITVAGHAVSGHTA